MGHKKTKFLGHFSFLQWIVSFFVLSAVVVMSLVIVKPQTVSAVGSCPGSETQGTGTAPFTNQNLCYTPTGQATSNIPTSTATPGTTAPQDPADAASAEEGTTCAVEKIGWILCPIIEGSSKMADLAFAFLANNFLAIEPELLTSTPQQGAGTITAWEQARNLANILFVIVFVIIIYSQITGSGLNNYGVKRMLPRLIIAAIAVNVSYYICQALVDLSNILGYNVMQALQDITKQIGQSALGGDSAQGINTQTSSDGGWILTIAVGVLAVAGLVWVFLPVLGSIALFILVTCITIILILLLRKAFIVMLVVISPLAFVLYLLPNTEKYFDKWLSMFWKLLLVFPIVALLMGGGQLASTIILVAGSQDQAPSSCGATSADSADAGSKNVNTSTYGVAGECTVPVQTAKGEKQAGWMLGLVAAGIAVAPLLAVWSVLQGALAAAGAIGGKIGGVVNNMNKGAGSRMKKGIGETIENRQRELQTRSLSNDKLNALTLGSARRSARRRARTDRSKARNNEAYVDYVAGAAQNDGELTRFGRQLSGGRSASDSDRNRTVADAMNARNKLEIDNVKAAHAIIDNLDGNEIRSIVDDPNARADDPRLAAALERLSKVGSGEDLARAVAKFASSGQSSLASRSLGNALAADNPGYLKATNIDQISRGAVGQNYQDENGVTRNDGDFNAMVGDNIAKGIYSQEKMASSSPAHLDYAHQVAQELASRGDSSAIGRLKSTAINLQGNEKLHGSVSRSAKSIDEIAGVRFFSR